ncbi:ATP-binding protein, partial [Brevundimonas sp.]|uniref:chemotaxis protein CheA n=1 Tax=Brevundimonas sp. TaxID=1871086 RepID=UPI0017EC194B
FANADPDRLQAAMRDSLGSLARKAERGRGFATALAGFVDSPLTAAEAGRVLALVGESLGALDIADAAIDELAMLVDCEPAAAATSAPEAYAAPASDAVVETGPAPVAVTSPASASSPRSEVEPSGPAQTIRVSVDALEHLMTVVSELVLIRNQLIQTLRLEPESPFAAPLNRLNQVTSELQEGVMTTRMQPISGAWAKLPRLVRDLAQDLGKSIDLVMVGQDTELDRQVLELIKDPLTHMIRNAADHGLETPAEQAAAGKPETGRITLQARHEGGAIVIEISDDGRGLPAEKLRAKAVAAGVLTPLQAEQMSDLEARQLIFLPGLSTAAEVTSVSGRGVGMDVVRTNIEKIGGAIELASVEGRGACFTIRIPLTLTIVSALIVE